MTGFGRLSPVTTGESRPKADSLTGSGLISLRLESIYETRGRFIPLKPVMRWACRELSEGFVVIGVDVDLSGPGEPEPLLGYRRAIHSFHFDKCADPVMEFTAVIAEITKAVLWGS